MQEVTGSSPVSPTTSPASGRYRSVERDAPRGADPREPGRGWKPDDRLRIGTTRERPANRPGSRPIARPRVRHRLGGEGGWDRERKPLVLSMDEGFRDS